MTVQSRLMHAAAALNVLIYRASGGRLLGQVQGVPVLLLTVAGRQSGVAHTTPLSYFEDRGRFVVAGSAAGAPSEPQWFRNLRRADRAGIEVGSQRFNVTISIAGPEERRVLMGQLIARAPFFAKYLQTITREIPLALLTPTS
jgi:deazaflavin-dependent oxidoreductase (nitroreductase family)